MPERPFGHWWERVAIVVALASLWPWALRWRHPAWRLLTYAMLVVMAVLFVVNVHRLWRMGHPPASDDSE